ncbi:MAG TPA: hypothetical protein PKE30_21970, partial [Niabella sp.]|nr:hypothetical protein [Niabella sp.]
MIYPALLLLSFLLAARQKHSGARPLTLALLLGLLFAGSAVSAQKTSDKTAMEEERRKLQLELRQIQEAYNAV